MPRFKSFGDESTFEIPSGFVPFEVIPNPTRVVSKIERHAGFELRTEGKHYADVTCLHPPLFLYKSVDEFFEVTSVDPVCGPSAPGFGYNWLAEVRVPSTKEILMTLEERGNSVNINLTNGESVVWISTVDELKQAISDHRCLAFLRPTWRDEDVKRRVQSRIWICEDISNPMRDFLLLCLKFVGHYNSSFSTGTYAVAKVAN
ncbi:MAG: hypothetical protein JST12_09270 [Armatimonadetes bacterium]|nr:hypothetical protein [Armatimonadota bacterium]